LIIPANVTLRVVWSFHSSVSKNSGPVGCSAVSLGWGFRRFEDTILWTSGSHTANTASHPRRPESSWSELLRKTVLRWVGRLYCAAVGSG